ncbi:hypothetical protein GQR58_027700 [Nymphon striatum]|nr:hypothetical protein GQR58_027700 [Nymphon striatum]
MDQLDSDFDLLNRDDSDLLSKNNTEKDDADDVLVINVSIAALMHCVIITISVAVNSQAEAWIFGTFLMQKQRERIYRDKTRRRTGNERLGEEALSLSGNYIIFQDKIQSLFKDMFSKNLGTTRGREK